MVHDMVNDKEDIVNALALNSGMVNIARLIGPALSGLVLQRFGAGVCFSLNAISFIAVLASLLMMKLPAFVKPAVKKKVSAELAEGFAYLRQTPSIGAVIILITVTSLFVLPYDTTIPVFAKLIFHGNAATFGYLASCIGAGAICASLFLASLKKGTNLRIVLLCSIAILGVGLILFSQMKTFTAVIPFAVLVGFSSLTPMTTSITIIQVEAAAHMRGRVMGYVAMGFFGMLPLGSLLIGSVSQRIGAPLTMLFQGIMALVIAAVFSQVLKLKPKMSEPKKEPAMEVANV